MRTLRSAAERALVASSHKLVVSERAGGEEVALFWIGREGEDLAAAERQTARELRGALDALRAGLGPPPPATPRAVSDEERARLAALGYGAGTLPSRGAG